MKSLSLSILLLLLTGLSATAEDFTTISANCLWRGNNREIVNQACRVSGTSQLRARSIFKILWEDGYKTIVQRTNSGSFSTPSGRPVQLSENAGADNFGFPQNIDIIGQGKIRIKYQPLPDYIQIDRSQQLQVKSQTKTNLLSLDYTYQEEKFASVASLISNSLGKGGFGSFSRTKPNKTYQLRDQKLTLTGSFPITFVTQSYSVPVATQTAIANAYKVSPEVNFSRAMILQKNRALYASSPLGGTDIILESCLFHKNDVDRVSKTVCIFSTP